ncbi:hypothetical protein HY637_03530 [Candidatus Woesearchaeota archaeon]|nr:hypothetical protein [Candidatus Woesearchaeota archaeon]
MKEIDPKVTHRQIWKALVGQRISLAQREREEELLRDWERVQGGSLSGQELEQMIEKYSPSTKAVNVALDLGERGLRRALDATKKYGPGAVKGTLKGTVNAIGALSNRIGTGIGWTYNNLVYSPISRVYGTIEKAMTDSPVSQSVVETTGNVTVAGINAAKHALLYAVLLASMTYAAEAYRPGTVGKLMRETPANMVKGIKSAVQEIYKSLPKPIIVLPQEQLPQYNNPLSPGTHRAV